MDPGRDFLLLARNDLLQTDVGLFRILDLMGDPLASDQHPR
jgi:hypothetical protein